MAEDKRDYEKELQKLKAALEGNKQERIDDLKREFDKEKKKMQEDYAVQLMIAKAKADQKMSEIRFDYEKLLRAKEQAVQNTISENKALIDRLQEDMAQRNQTINELKDLLESVTKVLFKY
jgi:DNA transposition AAA+ family ATPase